LRGHGHAIKTASRDKKTGEIRRFPTDAFNFIIQINLVGTYRCIAISAQGMLSLDPLEGGERGAIVNTASVAAQDGQVGQAAYSASKGGVNALTLVWRATSRRKASAATRSCRACSTRRCCRVHRSR